MDIWEDILDAYYFYFDDTYIYQLQKLSDQWKQDYNNNHLHKSMKIFTNQLATVVLF